MIEIRRILCPIDFSDCSRRALDHAVAIANWYDSTITLEHVSPIVPLAAYAPGSGVVPSANLSPAEREALLTSMRQFAAAEASPDIRFDYILGEGGTAAQVLNAADTLASDLIVIGTHGRSGFERLMLGSVTEKVLRKATCPVLSVPPHSTDAVPVPPLFTRILCAVDFSECSIHALEYAMSLAQEAGGTLTVLHVIDVGPEIPDIHGLMMGGVPDVREFIARVDEGARAPTEGTGSRLRPDVLHRRDDGRRGTVVSRGASGRRESVQRSRLSLASTAAVRLIGCSSGPPRSRWCEPPPARCSRCGRSRIIRRRSEYPWTRPAAREGWAPCALTVPLSGRSHRDARDHLHREPDA